MVHQAFQRQNSSIPSYFEADELRQILEIFPKHVKAGTWKDYCIVCADHKTSFVVLDNGVDIASISRLKDGGFEVGDGFYTSSFSDFDRAFSKFDEGFNNQRRSSRAHPALRVVR